MPAVPVHKATRRFWLVSSVLGIIVCGAMTLFWGLEGYWRQAGMFGICLLCNVFTYWKYSRSSAES